MLSLQQPSYHHYEDSCRKVGGLKVYKFLKLFDRLHLVESVGKISLAEVTLTEDPGDEERVDEGTGNESGCRTFK